MNTQAREAAKAAAGVGIRMSEEGRFHEAVEHFTAAIAADASFMPGWAGRAYARNKLHEFEQALRDHNQAIELVPGHGPLYQNRGVTHEDLENWEEALADFTRALELGGTPVAASTNCRGAVYFKSGRQIAATAEFNIASAVDPDYLLPYLNRGLLYSQSGDHDKALTEYERAVALAPADPDVRRGLARAQARAGLRSEALRTLDLALQDHPSSVDGLNDRAATHAAAGDLDSALVDTLRCLDIDPTSPECLANHDELVAAIELRDRTPHSR